MPVSLGERSYDIHIGEGLLARIFQHETDHLQGILYPDRMRSLETLSFLDEYTKFWTKGGKA